MAFPHHYALLGLPHDADLDAIKRAWKRVAARWHPDLRPGPSTRFDAAREAWHALSDPERRRAYDSELQDSVDAAIASMSKLHGTERIGGLVSRVLGVRERATEVGRNRRLRLTVGLAEAVLGTERDVQIGADVRCVPCDATGAAATGRTMVCATCGGIGEVLTHGLLRSTWEACGTCASLGWTPSLPCEQCGGRGVVAGTLTMKVPIPANTRQGQTLKIAGAGEPAHADGKTGDLLVTIDVRPHAFLVIDGVDLRGDRPVPFWLALAGGRVEVPTLRGSARIQIPAGSRSGDVLRMAGYGLEHAKGRGDQLVTIRVEWPAQLDPNQVEALRTWAAGLPPDVFAETAAFEARLTDEVV